MLIDVLNEMVKVINSSNTFKCTECGQALSEDWLAGDRSLLLCDKDKCWESNMKLASTILKEVL